ncbi:MAG: sugar transferase [Muribaculaceae bacterium]|nr:sugar transferase [Roseburia sp.]MCM1431357.1 sugar transferase [Muribaculaceae bacterium]MCM1491799.1 sugar transferase [Muribaculaceae bacterium]
MYQKNAGGWMKHLDFMVLDILCLQVSFFLAYLIRHQSYEIYKNSIYANLAIVLVFMDIIVLLCMNTLKNVLKRNHAMEFIATLRQMCVLELLAALYLFSVKDAEGFSRMTFYLMGLLYTFITYGVRILWKKHVLRKLKRGLQKSVIIITDQIQFPRVEHDIRNKCYEMFQVSGIVILDIKEQGVQVGDLVEGIPVVADGRSMLEYICREWVDEVFIDIQAKTAFMDVLVNQLMEMGVTIHIKLVERFALNNRKQFVEKMGKYTVLTTSINTVSGLEFFFKRCLDILGGCVGCVITGILFIFLAPAIYIQSPGPVFFTQTRIGRNGKKFKLYKFRSMYLDAEEKKAVLMKDNRIGDGRMFKLEYDPRIIGCKKLADGTIKKGLGNWMRERSIDEFPQFWNVLKGEMSLVGTRPPTEDEWVKYELHHRSRLAIKPGITGMWQISGRSDITEFEKVVELDRYYITNWDLGLDMKILCKTVPIVFGKNGAM